MKYLIVQDKASYNEYPISPKDHIDMEVKSYIWTQYGKDKVMVIDEDSHFFERRKEIFLSENNGDIRIKGCSAQIIIQNGKLQIENGENTLIYLNQEKIGNGRYELEDGAVLFIENCKIVVGSEYLTIWGKDYQSILCETESKEHKIEQFPLYKRSPRLIKRVETKKIRIEAEPSVEKMGAKGLAQTILPPLGMLAVTVMIGILLKRGLMMLMSVSATVMTTIFSIVKYFQDQKACKDAYSA